MPGEALLTDLYQLTMAQGYWERGIEDSVACFHMTFRENPFQGSYTVAAGLAQVVEHIESYSFTREDREYLQSQTAPTGEPLFKPEFLDYLEGLHMNVDIDAVPEGTIMFPREPIVRVTGPIVCCQLLETALLNTVNFQSLIATKAARVCQAAAGAPVAEFGLRRAQGPNGGTMASRAAYIGGCASTSNVEAGKRYGIPVSGTHAHSWVMAFPSELEAFRAFAEVMPHNCVLLVDTYTTIEGVKNAIKVGKEMAKRGEALAGVRIDSGDILKLSVQIRKMLDDAGLENVKIVASNDLDEYSIHALVRQGACVDSWGVGTRLSTAYDQPALAGVYKLTALKGDKDKWLPKIKVSEQISKMTIPGIIDTRRYRNDDGTWAADMIYETTFTAGDKEIMIDPVSNSQTNLTGLQSTTLFEPVMRGGVALSAPAPLGEIRDRCTAGLKELNTQVKRLHDSRPYPVGLDYMVYKRQAQLVLQTLPQKDGS